MEDDDLYNIYMDDFIKFMENFFLVSDKLNDYKIVIKENSLSDKRLYSSIRYKNLLVEFCSRDSNSSIK